MQGMRDLIRGTLCQSLRSLAPEDRLAAAWPVACGPLMAPRGELLAFTAGILRVQVADPAWLRQMISIRSLLQNDLARIAGVHLDAIHFEAKPQLAARPSAAGKRHAPAKWKPPGARAP